MTPEARGKNEEWRDKRDERNAKLLADNQPFISRIESLEADNARLRVALACQTKSLIHGAQRIVELEAELESLNRMLREHGYGQGQIDAYHAECERIDQLGAENARLLAWIRGSDHRRSCPQARRLLLESDPEPETCTCGLNEILKVGDQDLGDWFDSLSHATKPLGLLGERVK
jgi:hypothetical protein